MTLFSRSMHQEPVELAEGAAPGETADVDVSPEYYEQVHCQLRRLGVPASLLEVDVHCVGDAPDGRPLYMVLLKITEWQKLPALRLLLAHGFLEASVRKAVMGSWLADVSHFAGVWLRLSSRLQGGETALDIRRVLKQFDAEEAASEMRSGPQTLGAVIGPVPRARCPGVLQ